MRDYERLRWSGISILILRVEMEEVRTLGVGIAHAMGVCMKTTLRIIERNGWFHVESNGCINKAGSRVRGNAVADALGMVDSMRERGIEAELVGEAGQDAQVVRDRILGEEIASSYTQAGLEEAMRDNELRRANRDTVPYTEPGPTTSGLVTKLQKEAEEAYELLWRARARIQAMQNTLATAYGTRDAMAEACLADIECHIQKHGERYRKQGGG